MKVHRIEVDQKLPIGLDEAWEFFSTPKNLDLITPPDMSFEILSGADSKAYAGQLIRYNIKPLFNISMNWITEITQCVDRAYFIDEQRFGPYKFWHHQHHFKEVEGGVKMKDILHYGIPLGFFGEIMGDILIHKKVQHIFNYREQKLNEIFQYYPEKIAV